MSVPGAFHPLWYNIRTVTKCGVSTAALFDRNILSAQESVGVSPRDHIEGLDHTREAFMSAALSDGERSTQKTPSLPGVLRGALGWIDLPRRRTFDPKLQVGEQACYGGVTKEKESRGIPRGALDWIDLPRRRTFDPELHVGEQASYGESTNETESRGVPRGSLDWIDLPRRRTFDLKLHVGEQACHGEGTTEIESRGVPRGTLDWIDLPRRRTFDPKLHVGEQACSGEDTNEIEIRSAPRGALDWIDLPRRRTFDPKLHVGEQACVGEGTNEIEVVVYPGARWIGLIYHDVAFSTRSCMWVNKHILKRLLTKWQVVNQSVKTHTLKCPGLSEGGGVLAAYRIRGWTITHVAKKDFSWSWGEATS